ncbi:RNA polymerase sigma factor [Devosia rhodophyticola]|uniref:RNA polymerase sigma factor n=1 Tax=Devosia rhodophyticola TaxID=3026423 RepID=UPI002E21BCA5
MNGDNISRAIETVWRMEAPRLVAGLVRMVRDISLAEELAQEALVGALQSWPKSGVPDNPGAWLMTSAKRCAIDYFRHNAMVARKLPEIAHATPTDASAAPDPEALLDAGSGDDLLNLMFVACHPALSPEAQSALTLRLIGGLSTNEIARAFLVSEATMAQRIVRAKRTLAEAGERFAFPNSAERQARLGSVLGVLYLIFNEGYSATTGQDWMRPQLCEEAMRMGRILAQMVPDQSEVHGLVALMELQASRFAARHGADGTPILLAEQNRARWDRTLIGRGLAGVDRARAESLHPGSYSLQAAIAACHARAALSCGNRLERDCPTLRPIGTNQSRPRY